MCLEFMCSWCHRDEDGPEQNRPQTPHTRMPASSAPNYNLIEHKDGNNQPSKNESPSRPHFDPSINSYSYPAKDEHPSKLRSEQSVSGSQNGKDEYNHVYPARDEPPPKFSSEPSSNPKNTSRGEYDDGKEYHVLNGVVNGDVRPRHGHPKTNFMAFNGDKASTTVHPGPIVSVPHVRDNTVLTAPVQQPNLRRGAESDVLHTNGHITYSGACQKP